MPNQIPLTDLRIGDHIGYKHMIGTVEGIVKRSDGNSHVWIRSDNIIVKDEIEYFSGIPLTEEWLEIFSFKETTDRPYKDQKAYYIFEDGKMLIYSAGDLYKRTGDGGFLRITGRWEYGRFNRIDFVHDIQNCIHALTGEELTLKQ